MGAQASLISQGQPVTCVGYYDVGSEVFPCSNVVDGIFDDTGSPSNWSFWLSPPGVDVASVTVDLGAEYNINEIKVQDTHNRDYYDRGTQDFTIGVSSDGTNFTQVIYGTFSNADWINLTILDFLTSTTGRYVQFNSLNRWGCCSIGLNEIQVFGDSVATVPEPGTLSIFAAGLIALGMMRRRVAV
jgi:F5/8 type C domain/PEP-CTERM motif